MTDLQEQISSSQAICDAATPGLQQYGQLTEEAI